jgi:glycosyltransferase involved in cell wall biosynthesis
MTFVFVRTDAMLANGAGRVARRAHQSLYCYHDYVPRIIPAGSCLIVFVYHPLPKSEYGLLEDDSRRYPEAAASFAKERRALGQMEKCIPWDRASAVVCASSFTAESVIADGCSPDKIKIVPYGLPDAGPKAVAEVWRSNDVEFLFVGQGIQRKGLHHLIRAWQLHPRMGCRLTIVSYQIDPAIASLITDASIRLLGYQSREELDSLFAAADVFVMPSLIEGFGLVYLEALAHGCHIIGSPNSGLPDLGFGPDAVSLVSPGGVAELAAAPESCSQTARVGGYNKAEIAKVAERWTQAHFRQAIGDHATQVLREFATDQVKATELPLQS